MPQCKALKTFEGRYGRILTDMKFDCEQGYAVELKSKGLVEILDSPLEPSRRQAIETAPLNKGSAGLVAVGEARPAVSSRPVLPSHLPTAPPSKPLGNAKR